MIKHHKGKIMILLLQNAIQYQAISISDDYCLDTFRSNLKILEPFIQVTVNNHKLHNSSGTTNIFILRESFCRLKSELISSRKNKSVRVRNNILVVLYLTFADFSIICLSAMCRIDETINLLNYFVTVQNK